MNRERRWVLSVGLVVVLFAAVMAGSLNAQEWCCGAEVEDCECGAECSGGSCVSPAPVFMLCCWTPGGCADAPRGDCCKFECSF